MSDGIDRETMSQRQGREAATRLWKIEAFATAFDVYVVICFLNLLALVCSSEIIALLPIKFTGRIHFHPIF
jgi:hypothetical protein